MTAVVIPSLGAPVLEHCLDAVAQLDPAPSRVILVVSGVPSFPSLGNAVELIHFERRLGFAAAVNAGVRRVLDTADAVALLNDDAVPATGWLHQLETGLAADTGLAALQGTVTDAAGERVDGRGITLDRWALPVQVDRGEPVSPEPSLTRPVLAVSATAAIFRAEALRQAAFDHDGIFDERFGSYHEDLDLGLRLRRLGWKAEWRSGAHCRHAGSSSGTSLVWRHPWWVLANRWRALAGNLRPAALVAAMPRLLRGELRAVRTLMRTNPRAPAAAAAVLIALPILIMSALRRPSPGPRLKTITGPGA